MPKLAVRVQALGFSSKMTFGFQVEEAGALGLSYETTGGEFRVYRASIRYIDLL